MEIQPFFDPVSSALTYVVWDRSSRIGVVIDPVLGFDPETGRISTDTARDVLEFIDRQGLAIPYVLDTHPHADHLTGLSLFRRQCGSQTAIGAGVADVQSAFRALGRLDPNVPCDGSQFDVLLEEGVPLGVGSFEIEPFHTPGHTRACMSYRVEDMLFVGDFVFQPDFGTGRCDFPGGSAEDLYDSLYRIYRDLPDSTRVFTGHDYQPGGRPLAYESTIWDQRTGNIHCNAFTHREEFVAFRKERDAGLAPPKLLGPAMQFNLRGGACHQASTIQLDRRETR